MSLELLPPLYSHSPILILALFSHHGKYNGLVAVLLSLGPSSAPELTS